MTPPGKRVARSWYWKYSAVVAIVLGLGSGLIVLPLWVAHPPYGKAVFLSLPPMLACALIWIAGVWWAWGKNRSKFLAVTLGATLARLTLGLAWSWMVLSTVDVPRLAFVLGLMWHWLIFTIPEFMMAHELSQQTQDHSRSAR